MPKEKIKIKTGQKWRSKQRNFIVIVGKKLRDDWWKVHTSSRNRAHEMQEHSFHFFDLLQQ